MKAKAAFLLLALTSACGAQSPAVDQALQRILLEANGRGLVLVAEPPPKSTTSIPEADQISEEEEDPGAAIPS